MEKYCACCPETEGLRKFGDEYFCKECVGDGIEICSQCGAVGDWHKLATYEIDICDMCRQVDTFNVMYWEDGELFA